MVMAWVYLWSGKLHMCDFAAGMRWRWNLQMGIVCRQTNSPECILPGILIENDH